LVVFPEVTARSELLRDGLVVLGQAPGLATTSSSRAASIDAGTPANMTIL